MPRVKSIQRSAGFFKFTHQHQCGSSRLNRNNKYHFLSSDCRATVPAYMNLSLKSLEEALGIRRQIETLETRLAALFGPSASAGRSTSRKAPRRRSVSAAARARMAAAQRARWAKRKAGSAAKVTSTQPKRKGGLTAAGRKRLSDNMKARWAARKRNGTPNTRK